MKTASVALFEDVNVFSCFFSLIRGFIIEKNMIPAKYCQYATMNAYKSLESTLLPAESGSQASIGPGHRLQSLWFESLRIQHSLYQWYNKDILNRKWLQEI